MEELLKFLIESLVEDKSAVQVEKKEDEKSITLKVSVADGDLGKVIGKNGKTAGSIRNIIKSVAAKSHKKVFVKFED